MKKANVFQFTALFSASVFLLSWTPSAKTIYGKWKLLPNESTAVTTWSSINLDIRTKSERVIVERTLSRGIGSYTETFSFVPGGKEETITLGNKNWSEKRIMEINWPENRFMGVRIAEGTICSVSGSWIRRNIELKVSSEMDLQVNQGIVNVKTIREYSVESNGKLKVTEKRSTREGVIIYYFEKMK
jgi:hypothetical protein